MSTRQVRARSGIVLIEERDDVDLNNQPILVELHRDTGSGETVRMVARDSRGRMTLDRYFLDDAYHRIDGPAYRSFRDGVLTAEKWSRFGKRHRIDGPAVLFYENKPEIQYTEWYLRGVQIDTVQEVIEQTTRPGPDAEDLRVEFARSRFGPLVQDGYSIATILPLVDQGIATVEGIRAALDGAPVDWVLSFEHGIDPDQTVDHGETR